MPFLRTPYLFTDQVFILDDSKNLCPKKFFARFQVLRFVMCSKLKLCLQLYCTFQLSLETESWIKNVLSLKVKFEMVSRRKKVRKYFVTALAETTQLKIAQVVTALLVGWTMRNSTVIMAEQCCWTNNVSNKLLTVDN